MKAAYRRKRFLSSCLISCMLFSAMQTVVAADAQTKATVINVLEYGADPTGEQDSADAVWAALQAAKEAEVEGNRVVLDFPKGEYHIYKDHTQEREYHTSNTNSIDNPKKRIGILIEGHKNLTVKGNDSLFMMHGNMMALAVVDSQDIVLQDFSWDFGVPTVSEMTVMDMGTEGQRPYTDFYIPSCFPYEIKNNTIQWFSEKSPYTGEYYWTEEGIHSSSYGIVGYQPENEMARNYNTSESPFSDVYAIEKLEDRVVRIMYNKARPEMQQEGMIIELTGNARRETAGAFIWESSNVTSKRINVHFMHGFGWLVQMSKDVSYYDCNFMPRKNSGHVTVGFADGIHASGAAGEIIIDGCNFANTHDDPINLHGTFTRVEQRIDDNTLQLKYIHEQQGGFPQYHVGDQVAFFTRDTLESTDGEALYTVKEVVSNPGEKGNDLRTMEIHFAETLPQNLSDRIGNEPKYVAENVSYAPQVTIRNCTFKNVPTRGILCTTRKKVLIEKNIFLNMSMATIYLSNDSDAWYESGPIRDMTIRENTFYIKSIGRTAWEYAPAVYINPVTKGGQLPSKDNPIHKNITIEKNEFFMDVDTVVKAESVENLTIRDNHIWRTNPDVELTLEAVANQMQAGDSMLLKTTVTGDTHTRDQDNVFEFKACKNVVIEGNTYDDGLKRYAVLSDMTEGDVTNKDAEIRLTQSRSETAAGPAEQIYYASSDPEAISVDSDGRITAKKAGSAVVYAYYIWNRTIVKSNSLTITTAAAGTTEGLKTERQLPDMTGQGDALQAETGLDAPSVQTTASGETADMRLDCLAVNGVNLLREVMEPGTYEVLIPAGMTKIELKYHALMEDEGTTVITGKREGNGQIVENAGTLVLQVEDGDEISVDRGGKYVYKIKIKTVESSRTDARKLEMEELNFSEDDFSKDDWWICTDKESSELAVTVDSESGNVRVLSGARRTPLEMEVSKNGDCDTYRTKLVFEEGINSCYIQIIAKDGITVKQFIVNILCNQKTGIKPPEEKPLLYTDVKKGDWWYDFAFDVLQKGLMTGLSNTLFGPDRELARAQFAVILYRMEGSPYVEYEAKFPDVKEGQFYTDAVMWASDKGVVTGYTDSGRFDPVGTLTREQMAAMLYRYAKYRAKDISGHKDLALYEDGAKVTGYAREALAWCTAENIITGDGQTGLLLPQKTANRAECAKIISRYTELQK